VRTHAIQHGTRAFIPVNVVVRMKETMSEMYSIVNAKQTNKEKYIYIEQL
jgi:hypothetical protein